MRQCQICRHPERIRIEALRLAGSSADAIAERFDLKRDAVYRHMANHVSADTKAALIADVPLRELADRAAAEGVSLIDYLAIVRQTVMTQMLGAASINDASGTAMLAGKALDVLKEVGKLTGEMLRAAPVSNVYNITTNVAFLQSPFFNKLETMLLDRLAPFPEALQAVLIGLDALDREENATAGRGAPLIECEAVSRAA